MDDDSEHDHPHDHSDTDTNMALAGEAIGGLLWLIEELAETCGVTLSEEAKDVVDRVDQIAHLLGS